MANWREVDKLVGDMIDNIEQRCLRENHSGTGWVCKTCRVPVTKLWIEAGGPWVCNLCKSTNEGTHYEFCDVPYNLAMSV